MEGGTNKVKLHSEGGSLPPLPSRLGFSHVKSWGYYSPLMRDKIIKKSFP